MARPSTALRRLAVLSATCALAGLTALAAAGCASAATVALSDVARVVSDEPSATVTHLGPRPYVVIVHHEGLVESLLDGLL
jgi:hypothetical protein